MSKATRQGMLALGYLESGLDTLITLEAREDIYSALTYMRDEVRGTVYPDVKDSDVRQIRAAVEKLGSFASVVDPQETWDETEFACVIINIGLLMLTDIAEKTKDRKKLDVVEPLIEQIGTLYELVDPDGSMFSAMEHSDKIVKIIESVIWD